FTGISLSRLARNRPPSSEYLRSAERAPALPEVLLACLRSTHPTFHGHITDDKMKKDTVQNREQQVVPRTHLGSSPCQSINIISFVSISTWASCCHGSRCDPPGWFRLFSAAATKSRASRISPASGWRHRTRRYSAATRRAGSGSCAISGRAVKERAC